MFTCINAFYSLLCLLDKEGLNDVIAANEKPMADEEKSLWFDMCKLLRKTYLVFYAKESYDVLLRKSLMFFF